MISEYIFFSLSAITLYCAIMVLISKKPVHSVLYLTAAFFTMAGHYILLNAQFLAVVHVIVYAGAIMVLFLFTVMLLNLNIRGEMQKPFYMKVSAIIGGGLLAITLIGAFRGYEMAVLQDPMMNQIGLVKNLGKVLFSDYLLPFELSSILFLSAMVGAVMLGKKEIQ